MMTFEEYMKRRAELETASADSKMAERKETEVVEEKIDKVFRECKEEMIRHDAEMRDRQTKALTDGRSEKLAIHERHRAVRRDINRQLIELDYEWRLTKEKSEGKEAEA